MLRILLLTVLCFHIVDGKRVLKGKRMLGRHLAANVPRGDVSLFTRAVIGLRNMPRYLNLIEPTNVAQITRELDIDLAGYDNLLKPGTGQGKADDQ